MVADAEGALGAQEGREGHGGFGGFGGGHRGGAHRIWARGDREFTSPSKDDEGPGQAESEAIASARTCFTTDCGGRLDTESARPPITVLLVPTAHLAVFLLFTPCARGNCVYALERSLHCTVTRSFEPYLMKPIQESLHDVPTAARVRLIYFEGSILPERLKGSSPQVLFTDSTLSNI